MKRLKFDQVAMDNNNVNIADVLMLLSRGCGRSHGEERADQRRVFECKTCNRQFSSFQALGGHRASHKKPRLSDESHQLDRNLGAVAKPKVHECSVCGLEFAIGQALGGHMRRHRAVGGEEPGHGFLMKKSSDDEKRVHVVLDLNLPPLDEEMESKSSGLELGLGMVC